ncbi:sufE-like protein 1, chloroplastic/mitochondrial [Aristolochia californica]|uniref:sufE-like protein 1, chloroplastic/mitochondrial n=1 Tax=Aristolochia californica TaxID=171875 RepID=UPI0035DC5D39
MAISLSFRLLYPKVPLSLHSMRPITEPSFLSLPLCKPSVLFSTSLRKHARISSSQSSSAASLPAQQLDSFPPNLQGIIQLFQSVQDPRAKYEQLLFYGRKLPPLQPQFKISENKVQGCVSQVWVHAYLDSDRNVRFEADSDSVLTKGLAALLVEGLSGQPPSEIVRVSPDFVQLLGLKQSLTPSRNNGFLNMLRLMQKKALQLLMEAEEGGKSGSGEVIEVKDSSSAIDLIGSLQNIPSSNGIPDTANSEIQNSGLKSIGSESFTRENNGSDETGMQSNTVSDDSHDGLGARGRRIKERLNEALHPVELEVEDISYQHAGHSAVRGSGDGETHFNVRIVSEEFAGKSLVKRHRLIYDLLQEELQSGLHALSIVAKTPAESGRK